MNALDYALPTDDEATALMIMRLDRSAAPVLDEVLGERVGQVRKWKQQAGNHPDGTGDAEFVRLAELLKLSTDEAAANGEVTFMHILAEEVYEAFAESDSTRLREELIQVAAVAVQWVEAIDRREGRI